MKSQQIIISSIVAFLVVATFGGCSKNESAANPHITVTADMGTNVMMVTNGGNTFMIIGKPITNDQTKVK